MVPIFSYFGNVRAHSYLDSLARASGGGSWPYRLVRLTRIVGLGVLGAIARAVVRVRPVPPSPARPPSIDPFTVGAFALPVVSFLAAFAAVV